MSTKVCLGPLCSHHCYCMDGLLFCSFLQIIIEIVVRCIFERCIPWVWHETVTYEVVRNILVNINLSQWYYSASELLKYKSFTLVLFSFSNSELVKNVTWSNWTIENRFVAIHWIFCTFFRIAGLKILIPSCHSVLSHCIFSSMTFYKNQPARWLQMPLN